MFYDSSVDLVYVIMARVFQLSGSKLLQFNTDDKGPQVVLHPISSPASFNNVLNPHLAEEKTHQQKAIQTFLNTLVEFDLLL